MLEMLGSLLLHGADFPWSATPSGKAKSKNGDAVPVIGYDFLRTCFRPVTLSIGCTYALMSFGALQKAQGMGCTYAESTLQPGGMCLRGYTLSIGSGGMLQISPVNLGTARWSLRLKRSTSRPFLRRVALRCPASQWLPTSQCHDITRWSGTWAVQKCLPAWCCCRRCRSRFRVPSAG